MYGGKELPKQRGIYSEILTTEDTKHLQVRNCARHPALANHCFFVIIGGVHVRSPTDQLHPIQQEVGHSTRPR